MALNGWPDVSGAPACHGHRCHRHRPHRTTATTAAVAAAATAAVAGSQQVYGPSYKDFTADVSQTELCILIHDALYTMAHLEIMN